MGGTAEPPVVEAVLIEGEAPGHLARTNAVEI